MKYLYVFFYARKNDSKMKTEYISAMTYAQAMMIFNAIMIDKGQEVIIHRVTEFEKKGIVG